MSSYVRPRLTKSTLPAPATASGPNLLSVGYSRHDERHILIEAEIAALIEAAPDLEHKANLMRSVKGIDPATVAAPLAYLPVLGSLQNGLGVIQSSLFGGDLDGRTAWIWRRLGLPEAGTECGAGAAWGEVKWYLARQ